MKSLGKRIKETLPRVKPRVEEMLEVNLGHVNVLPLPKFKDELAKDSNIKNQSLMHKLLFHGISILALGLQEAWLTTAKAGTSTIYYSRNPIDMFMQKELVEEVTAHELTHIAHARLCGVNFNKLTGLKREILEGFAEYVGRRIVSEMYGRDYKKIVPFMKRGYGREEESFRNMLEEESVKTNQDLVAFIKRISV